MKILLFFISTCLGCASVAQTKGNIKLYGYVQPVSQGRAPDYNEAGKQRAGVTGKNYFLYAASDARIYPVELWIEGEKYSSGLKTVTSPVEYQDEMNIGSPKKILVPLMSKRVIHLIPGPAIEDKNVGERAEKLAKTNELVLVYKLGGKFYYNTLESLTAMDAAAAQ